ncbi:MAG: hypothetical protein HY306_00850 [Nitrosomonadales bacterium]|nr:hypothetical protein [Nitrosomonadales bacterium]
MRTVCHWLLLLLLFFTAPVVHAADTPTQKGDSVQVMEAFEQQPNPTDGNVLTDKEKRKIMFLLGVPLLLLILVTGALGIAMALYGKQVFVMHTVFAGLTVTLALAHTVVALVWFNPF